MRPPINPGADAPDAYKAMVPLEKYIHGNELEFSMVELVKMLTPQIKGCAFCFDMHSKDGRTYGEIEQLLYLPQHLAGIAALTPIVSTVRSAGSKP